MSDPMRIALVGATGLVGTRVMELCVGRSDVRLAALARREAALPPGATMEMFVAETSHWGEVFDAIKPRAAICALGTTWKKAGQDEAAFRAVDHDLVLQSARAAKASGVERFVVVSSCGAAAGAKQFYLKVKGEMERDLARVGFERLDILRPGLLRGPRDNDRRPLERLGIMVGPMANLFLHGKYRAYRSIDARVVAEAALTLCLRKAKGRFVHDNDGILRAARELADA